MINLSWKIFSNTGNVDMYLLYKELSCEEQLLPENISQVQPTQELPNS